MNHPILNFFGLEGAREFKVDLYYPRGTEKTICCVSCKKIRSYRTDIEGEIRVEFSQIREDHFYEGSDAVECKGDWPEIIQVSTKPPLVRADVLDKMLKAGISGFRAVETNLTVKISKTLNQDVPKYFYLEISGSVEVFFPNNEVSICPSCRCFLGLGGHKLMVPDMKTWSGDDLIMTSNVKTGFILASPKLIDLAKSENWRSFEFGSSIPHVLVRLFEVDDWRFDIAERVCQKYPELFNNRALNSFKTSRV